MSAYYTTEDIILYLEARRAERDWASLGSMERGQINKIYRWLRFEKYDIGARVKASCATSFDQLIAALKKAKYAVTLDSYKG